MADLGKAWVQIVPTAKGISGEIAKVMDPESKSAGESAGTSFSDSFGKQVKAALIGLGIGKIVTDAFSSGAEFENSMAKASTLFSGTTEEFKGLQTEIMGISSATGVAASQLAEAAYSAESASVPMGNLGGMIDASSKLATAGFTDIDTALSATAKTMNAYGMMSEDTAKTQENMEKVQRILIQTQNKGITTVGELGASLANVTPTAASAGVSFEQVGASLALMTAKGTPTAQATTQVRSAIAELEKSGTKASLALEQAAQGTEYAGMSFTEMMASGADLGDVMGMLQDYADKSGVSMLDLWSSIEGGNAAMAIASDVGTFKEDLAAMATEADVVGEAYSTMADTAEFKINKFKTALQNVGINTFATLAEPVGNVLEGILDVSERLWPSVETLGGAFMNMMGSFGQYIGDMLGLEEGFSGVDAAVAVAQPVIEGITGAFDFLGEHADVVVPILTGVVGAFVGLQALSAVIGIVSGVGGALALLVSPAGLAVAAIAAVIAIGVAVYKNWDTIKEKASQLAGAVVEKWEGIKSGVSEKVEGLKTAVSEKWESIKSGVTEKADFIRNTAAEKFESLRNSASETFENARTAISDKLGAARDFASGAFESIKGFAVFDWSLPSLATDAIDTAQSFVGGAIDTIKGLMDFNWSLPELKLPHIHVDRYIDVPVLGTIPDPTSMWVEWYRKAYSTPYMFTKPTVLPDGRGFGDGPGGEMVYGHDNLMRDIREAVGGAGTFAPVINVYAAAGQDVNDIAERVMEKINFEYGRAGKVYA